MSASRTWVIALAAAAALGAVAPVSAQLVAPAHPAAPPADTTSTRRGLSSPFDSPPYPSSEWQLGGSPQLGDANATSDYLLMKAIYRGNTSGWWRHSRVHIYGWASIGGNASTSSTTNAPAAYAIRPNRAELDQLVLRIERKPDEAQTDHFDWGFRFDNLYGLDYRFTTMKGVLSNQLLTKNNIYGYDPVMFYADLYFPHVAQGMNVRVGRYISLPDIEAQLAPDNAMYTHSLLYSYDPYTQMGVITTTKLSKNWTIQLGINAGNDVAVWAPGAKVTGTACVQWIASNNKDSFYPCVNSINSGQYGYNNLQDFVATYQHKFSGRVSTALQSYYMYQKNVPAAGGPITPIVGTNPAACPDGQIQCTAPVFGVLNQTLIRFANPAFLTVRNEYVNDIRGQRTGFATKYSEHALGVTWWPAGNGGLITVRPEARYEHSYNANAYDGGTKNYQFLAAMDVILHF